VPSIATRQLANEKNDPSLDTLSQILAIYRPDVLIVGNNAVPERSIIAWRGAINRDKQLLIIRRGVDTRAIDKSAASQNNIKIANLPGINSPYVAKHTIEHLQLQKARPNSKIAIIGVGNIGKDIAVAAIEYGLSVHLFSPSLQTPINRKTILLSRGIPPEKVVCASSIASVLENALYVSVAIPWEKGDRETNVDTIQIEHIQSLATNVRIVSASVPRIFSEAALNLINEKIRQQQMYVRIDTSKRRAIEIMQAYPLINAAYDEAFADPECQKQLDDAMLIKAREFIQSSLLNKVA
jgi:lactate dehydrogenase-like 2-hydroxyacid dehydrogenase